MNEPTHDEAKPKSGPIGEAAQAVASYCLLPEPRSISQRTIDFVTHFWRASQWQSEQGCITREIEAKLHAQAPAPKTPLYEHIMQHAEQFAAAGIEQCQVRDFDDAAVVPKPYYGYRGADGECHITHDKGTAISARKHYTQTR